MDVSFFVALLGGLLVLSWLADVLFETTRIPPVVVLIACGVVLGPGLGVVEPTGFRAAAPYFGAVALIAILFEGGLDLDLHETLRGVAGGTLLAVVSFLFTAGTLSLFAYGLLGIDWPSAGAFGAALGVPSSAIVLPLAGRLGLSDRLRTRVVLEASVADVLGILGVAVAIEARDGIPVLRSILRQSLLGVSVGAGLALVFGIAWSRMLRNLTRPHHHRFVEALTFGAALLLDWGVHALGGMSALAIVTFGLVLANEPVLAARFLKRPLPIEALRAWEERKETLHEFTKKTTFLVRTFFFVFLGMVVSWRGLTPAAAGVAALFLAVIVVGRRAAITAVDLTNVLPVSRTETRALASLLPRGLVTAVLAFQAVEAGLPGVAQLPLYAFLVLLATNVLMSIGLRASAPQPSVEAA